MAPDRLWGAMLVIDLRRLTEAPLEVAGSVDRDDPLWEGSGVELARPLTVVGRAEAIGGGAVRVHGSVDARLLASCRRCLKSIELDVAEALDLVFDPKATLADEDLTLYRLDAAADELDLRPALKERLILASSRYPVCREDCRGLCPRCGTDLNADECDCVTAEPDPRWGPLLATQQGSGSGEE